MPRRRDPDLTAEEKRLWDEVKKITAPLSKKKLADTPAAVKKTAKLEAKIAPSAPRVTAKQEKLKPAKKTETGAFDGIDHRTAKRFTTGEMEIDATLDLHGMTQPRAYDYLIRAVEKSYAKQHRMLLVITGKGRRSDGVAVLRAALPAWVNMPPLSHQVLALHPAQPKHGGSGACYLLLRRQRGST